MEKLEVTLEQAQAAETLTSVEKVHDPAELEKQMVEEEKKRLEPDQEEIACMMIKIYTPRFERLVDQMSNRQLRRVMKSLIAFPLGEAYNHKEGIEAEAFKIGVGLKDAQTVLVLKTYSDNREKIDALVQESRANTTIEFNSPENKVKEGSN